MLCRGLCALDLLVGKALHFPPPLPKKIFLVVRPQPSCVQRQSQEEFALRAICSSNQTLVLKPKFL